LYFTEINVCQACREREVEQRRRADLAVALSEVRKQQAENVHQYMAASHASQREHAPEISEVLDPLSQGAA
jgi:hypothetical protein